jgi:uncharacterized protein
MRYLFVTGHPAHVHLFKNVIRVLGQGGHEILVGAVSREVTINLLESYRIPYAKFGRSQPELISKALGVLPKEISLLKVAREFDPDLFVSTGSPYAAHVSALLARPHIVFGDTENASLTARITVPFTDAVYTPSCYQGNLGPKHVRYNGYKELAYLHPKYFRPDRRVLDRVGLSQKEPYLILRLASWDASHDLGDHGFRFTDTRAAISFVEELQYLGRVVITSDRGVDAPLNDFALACPPEVMHDVLAFARLYIGEGATMAAEAGVLGVPWIFISTRGRGFLSEQQDRYGLGYWVRDIGTARKILAQFSVNDFQPDWHTKRQRMLAEKEDVVSFICRAIEAWSSARPTTERRAG